MERSAIQRRTPLKRGKRINPIGKKGRARMKTSAAQTAKAIAEGHNFCELGPVLADFAIDYSPCFGDLTNAHSVKTVARGSDPVLDTETARSCTFHHYQITDLQDHETQARVVREAIKRRDER